VENRHHLYFPRKNYRTPLERAFRNLPCHIVWLDVEAHRLLHVYSKPPTKPRRQDMELALDRHRHQSCSCYAGERVESTDKLFEGGDDEG